jgi:hypothetical protein
MLGGGGGGWAISTAASLLQMSLFHAVNPGPFKPNKSLFKIKLQYLINVQNYVTNPLKTLNAFLLYQKLHLSYFVTNDNAVSFKRNSVLHFDFQARERA